MAEQAPSAAGAPTRPATRPSLPTLETFSAFKSRPFTYLWINTMSFALVQATQRFAFVWLVIEAVDVGGLGRGPAWSGAVFFALGIPVMFVTIPAGVLADRINRRSLILGSQLVAVGVTVAAGVIIVAGEMTTTIALVLAVGVGATIAVGLPVRNAIVPTVVDRQTLLKAIVMMSMAMNISQIVGPALGGIAIEVWGIGGAFIAQGVVLLVGTLALVPLRVPDARSAGQQREPMQDLLEGIRFVWGHRGIRSLILLLAVTGIFMMGPFGTLMPQIAKEELGRSAFEAGLLFAFMGAGMTISSLGIASVPDLKNKGGWFIASLMTAGFVLPALGFSPWYALTAVVIFLGGMGGGVFMNLNQTLVQANSPHEMMGRVVGIHTLAFQGIGPMGGILAGFMAHLLGAPMWMGISGGILLALTTTAFLTQPALRKME
ncbi:MAG: MFS transporter [Dehalococcoidia bacterium]|nr:MFS transporter [Chloroflexota bacterium]MYA52473.1 MFS transporter [Dehalococcoidia bacterium]